MKTISQFARQFGLSRSTLLYYERIDLLKPASLNAKGYRLYGDEQIRQMEKISLYRQAGLSLEAIQSLLKDDQQSQLRDCIETQLATLNKQIAALYAQQKVLLGLLDAKKRQELRTCHVNVAQWVAMLEEIGIDANGQDQWHQVFERDAPQAHEQFLYSLGLDETEVQSIRKQAKKND
ncbi:MerR family transcriptional regulator [Terasakiella sp. SH-1]|uniref:MerR family transcriptional regulator n=1 Tax=Terasakiella sp. SH-1 TaxID=2560057 RepID=UPI0010747212|nr:MerR family transcriptional regulator [Terasakiella sp. SH-1]